MLLSADSTRLPRRRSYALLSTCMPISPPTYPLSLSVTLIQQPMLPARPTALPRAAFILPLRLKVTVDLLLPFQPASNTRNLKLAQLAKNAAIYPSLMQGGGIDVRADLTVRGRRLPTLGWASERLRDIFLLVRLRDYLRLSNVPIPADDGRSDAEHAGSWTRRDLSLE